MKRFASIVALILAICFGAGAQQTTAFQQANSSVMPAGLMDRTVRLDYIFSGDAESSEIALAAVSSSDVWYGRRVNMAQMPVAGNGRIVMKDAETGKVLYANSFSTLFQEWQATPEAKERRRAFENTYLVPMPECRAMVTVELSDLRGNVQSTMTHPLDPADILIRESKPAREVEFDEIWTGGDPRECIDVVIIAEGYTGAEKDIFLADARNAVDAIFSHDPFKNCRQLLNFTAVFAESEASGVSVPREGLWIDTPVRSNFDTFYSDRYLTTREVFTMHNLLACQPYEHIIILANTEVYGGGGIYNSYTLTTAHHQLFDPVVVHEFGHSFGALADEYDYAGEEDPYYFGDVEPWEQNITTLADFDSKWADLLAAGVSGVGVYEGAGYQSKGVYRPAEDCRMRTNKPDNFCPVCQRAILRIIEFNTKPCTNP